MTVLTFRDASKFASVNPANGKHLEGSKLKRKHQRMTAMLYSVTTEKMSKIHDFSGGMFCHTQVNAST